MSSVLRRNIMANISGQAWSAVLGLLLVPVYLHYLGVEAYGLVGFFASLQAIIAVLDMGLGTTANREVARRTARAETAGESRNLVRTLEIIYWTVGLLIAVLFYAVSDLIATRWVQVRELSEETVRWAVVILGLTVAARWPAALYTGVLRGLEKQVFLNGLTAGASTLRGIGAIGVLVFVSPTVTAFLIWQLIAGMIEVAVFAWTAWRRLPGDRGGRLSFDAAILRTVWRFAAGMSGISILITILKQLDKVLISKLLPLEQLGYYTTASIAGMGLYLFITPMFNAVFPRFSSLVSHQDTASVADTFHRSAQFLSFVVAPMAGVLIFFAHDVLLLWTRSEAVASNAQLALSFFAFGTLMNGMVTVPYALQLASGLAWIALIVNALSVVVLVPLIYVLVNRFGIAGGAMAWAILNTSYYLIIPHIMHRYVLPHHKTDWIFKDTLPFILASLSVFGAAAWVSRTFHEKPLTYFLIFIGTVLYLYITRFFYPPVSSCLSGWFGFGKHVKGQRISFL